MKRGFSLVELSIVLVILGLLVGGILAGKSLIHAAELRTVPRDFQIYRTAFLSFKDKYFAIPGDMPNATQFWGALDGDDGTDTGGATCSGIVSTSTLTCNGNGDLTLTSTTNGEHIRAWQHLANAGLIQGKYTGTPDMVSGFGPAYYTRGLNIPASSLRNGAFAFSNTSWASTTYTNNQLGLDIKLIRPMTVDGGNNFSATPFLGVLSHEDAWNIDTKMDDGKADAGIIRADIIKASSGDVITDMTCTTYDLANTTNTCALAYRLTL